MGVAPARSVDLLQSRRGTALVVAALLVLFLAPRIALLCARDPFFDELFTQWIASKSFGEILRALRYDSGPPLYYLVVHALGLRGITALRFFSLLCACASAGLILGARWLGVSRYTAAALLAVYPPAALFAVDARAYALCALLVTAGVLALDRGRPFLAAALFLLAAYTHFYGVLFFPLLPMGSAVPRFRSSAAPQPHSHATAQPILACIVAVVLFLPGFYLASIQPREAIGWLTATQGSESHFAPLANASFAAEYPASLFEPTPWALVVVALIVLIVAVVRSTRFAPMALIPIGAAIALSFAGRTIYFPMRFESVVASPLVLWCAMSLDRWKPVVRGIVAGLLIVIGVVAIHFGVIDHLRRPIEPYRAAALFVRRIAGPDETVVASGYCYLEVVTHTRSRVIAFNPEQALHPGWRHRETLEEARAVAESQLPREPFIFVSEAGTPEVVAVRELRRLDPLLVNRRVVIVRARPRS